jgi:DNA excision repair protein ERCC-3
MLARPENPLIVQSDRSLLLETTGPRYAEARDALLGFAELVKSPEYVHTWRLTDLSLWNAAAAGRSAEAVIGALEEFARYPIPTVITDGIRSSMARYGALRLVQDGEWLRLESDDPLALDEVSRLEATQDLLGAPDGGAGLRVHPRRRGELKQVLVHLGHPVEDLVGYADGDSLDIDLSTELPDGQPWSPREYQIDAVDAFLHGRSGGSGVVVLPCGAGKTLVGIAAMAKLRMRTLILCTGHTALQQWKREIVRRTTLTEDDVGEYSARTKTLRPVTITTYQLLTWRHQKGAAPAHFGLFHQARWGLVIYDEVHLLPAPIFREAAGLQARRRLGLTATLVREDGREEDVFALIGPKRYDLPWKELERQGWIAGARCVEIRVPFSDADRVRYVRASPRNKNLLAAKNARKIVVLERLLEAHSTDQVLVIGTYLEQLEWVARRLRLPLITGDTPLSRRDELFHRFRAGEIRVLAMSKVGNFAVDLPGASVAIQISGTFGSRQEEAQRLGRVMRPKPGRNQATFYTLVTADSRELEFAERRRLFLAEQGYPYRIEDAALSAPARDGTGSR